jgi:hypothetical protein
MARAVSRKNQKASNARELLMLPHSIDPVRA